MTEQQSVDWKGSDRLWPLIDTAYLEMAEADERGQAATILAARHVDRGHPAGHRGYINAHRLLTIAHENHHAFLGMVNAVGFGPHAPFNLLRPVLENSLWAIWLLDPRQSHDRRRRGLQCEVQDHLAELTYLDELGKLTDNGRAFRDASAQRAAAAGPSYRREAAALGIPYKDLTKRVNLTAQIPELQWLRDRYGVDYLRIIASEWRRLSGYQHGKVWASMHGSDRTILSRVDGGAVAHFIASDDGISMAVGASSVCLLEGLQLYTHRCTHPA